MSIYTNEDRQNDFDFFVQNYMSLYKRYGHKYIAIRNKQILGVYNSIPDAVKHLEPKYTFGTYIIQECTGDESAYRTTIMRLIVQE